MGMPRYFLLGSYDLIRGLRIGTWSLLESQDTMSTESHPRFNRCTNYRLQNPRINSIPVLHDQTRMYLVSPIGILPIHIYITKTLRGFFLCVDLYRSADCCDDVTRNIPWMNPTKVWTWYAGVEIYPAHWWNSVRFGWHSSLPFTCIFL